jgi:cytochrome c biogenesis protein CcmG/thiol:disulfide interchange protein DsbE
MTLPRAQGRATSRLIVAPLVAFLGLALLLAYALKTGDPTRLPSALIGRPVPAMKLAPLEGLLDGGRPVRGFESADLAQGEVSVVNFWASWCAPCVAEHPVLIELVRRTGVKLYGINFKDQATAARRFLGSLGNPFVAVGVDISGRTAIEWGVYGMPETFVVDGRGRIVFKHVGPITLGILEGKLRPAIEAARRAGR